MQNLYTLNLSFPVLIPERAVVRRVLVEPFSEFASQVCINPRLYVSFFLFFFLYFGLVGYSTGREIYVDNVFGNDSFLGHTPKAIDENGPVRTIQRGLELAHASDTVILANNPGQPYRESVLVSGEKNSGMPRFPFRIIGNGAVIDGSEEIPPSYWHAVGTNGIFVYKPQYMEFQNLFFRGKPVFRLDSKNVNSFEELMNLDWKPMRWCMYQGHLYFKPKEAYMVLGAERSLPYDGSEAAQKRAYSMSAPMKRFGLVFFHVRNVVVENLTVQGFQNDGISASDTATYIQLKNVISRGNARAGLTVGIGCSVWLKDCVLGNNQYAQLITEDASLTSIFTSDLICYPAPGWIEKGGTVYRDKKLIKGGILEVADSGIEDEEAFFFGEKETETDVKEETIADDDDADEDSKEDSEGEEKAEEEESNPFDLGDDSEKTEDEDSDEGSNPFAGDDDSEKDADSEADSDDEKETEKDGDSEDSDGESGGFDFSF